MALCGEGQGLAASAAVQVMRAWSLRHAVTVAALGRALKHVAHNRLPLWPVGANATAKQLMGDQVRYLMGHGLRQKMFAIGPIQRGVKAQLVFLQMRHASFLPAQGQAHHGAGKGAGKVLFGKAIAGFHLLLELFWHAAMLPAQQGRAVVC